MTEWNVPDDWGMYYVSCSECGKKFHMSEGGCYCCENEEEQRSRETVIRLKDRRCSIDSLERTPARHDTKADFGRSICKGETEVRIFITEHDGVDEIVFTEDAWETLKLLIDFKEPENNNGRSKCWWCGKPTKQIRGLRKQYNVCSECEK